MSHNNNIFVLTELHKAAKMGMDSISFVSEKTEDSTFKDNLSFQYTQYGNLLEETNKLFENYGEIPSENNMKDKIVGWTGVQMNTINDKTTSHLADMLIQGTTMGMIEGIKLQKNYPNIENDIKNTVNHFVHFQEDSIEQLKKFL